MSDRSIPSITTAEGESGTDFVTAPGGLTAAIAVHHGTVVRRSLGPVVGYARFDGGNSEAVYADASGLHRATVSRADLCYDTDAVLRILG